MVILGELISLLLRQNFKWLTQKNLIDDPGSLLQTLRFLPRLRHLEFRVLLYIFQCILNKQYGLYLASDIWSLKFLNLSDYICNDFNVTELCWKSSFFLIIYRLILLNLKTINERDEYFTHRRDIYLCPQVEMTSTSVS